MCTPRAHRRCVLLRGLGVGSLRRTVCCTMHLAFRKRKLGAVHMFTLTSWPSRLSQCKAGAADGLHRLRAGHCVQRGTTDARTYSAGNPPVELSVGFLTAALRSNIDYNSGLKAIFAPSTLYHNGASRPPCFCPGVSERSPPLCACILYPCAFKYHNDDMGGCPTSRHIAQHG